MLLSLALACTAANAPADVQSASPANSPRSLPTTSPAPRGIILISMDTVRADATSLGGAADDATPTLSRLAKESVVFPEVYAQANETLFSHASAFTSRFPSDLGPVNYDLTIPDGTPTLASELKSAGFQTGAVVAGGHVARMFGLDDGFDTYAEGPAFGSFQSTVPMAVRWVDQAVAANQPFFLFVHGYDAHTPCAKPGLFSRLGSPGQVSAFAQMLNSPPFYDLIYHGRFYPGFRRQSQANQQGVQFPDGGLFDAIAAYALQPGVESYEVSPGEIEGMRALYQTAVLYGDLWVGVLVAELERRGLLETTDIVVMSDHGEALFQYGYMSHRHTIRSPSTRVSLLLRPAGGHDAQSVATPASLLDVTPTLLTMAGVTPPPMMRGRSLMPCFSGACPDKSLLYSEDALGEVSIVSDGWRVVAAHASGPAGDPVSALSRGEPVELALYKLADGEGRDHSADPAHAERLAALSAKLLSVRGFSEPAHALDPALDPALAPPFEGGTP